MIPNALVLLALAAVLGALLAATGLRRGRLGTGAALLHAAAAVGGLALLVAVVTGDTDRMILNDALALFVLAAGGGVLLLSFRLRRRAPPTPFVVIHGAVALIALLVLWAGYHAGA